MSDFEFTKLLKFSFEVDGEKQFHRAIDGVKESCKSLKPAFEEIVKNFYETEEKQFVGQGAFQGNKMWDRLSPLYADWKFDHFGALPILTLTGALRNSLTIPGAEGNINEITDTSMIVGTNIPYAIYHQKGTSRMPARPPIRLSEEQKKEWNSILHNSLQWHIKKSVAQQYTATFKGKGAKNI